MEQLKKELQEKGYTFFKMQDYPEFVDDYIKYKKYVCNSESNLLEYIDGVRIDGRILKKYNQSLLGGDDNLRINDKCASFDEIEKKVNNEYLPLIDENSFSQYWFFGENTDIRNDFEKLINNIVQKLYYVSPHSIKNITQLTYYKPGCFLKEHRDGIVGTRICAVLIYLNNEDYKIEWGGNIVFEGKETIPPIYGNVAVLDFKENNCLHEVEKVIDGYGRYAILSFASIGTSPEKPNHY